MKKEINFTPEVFTLSNNDDPEIQIREKIETLLHYRKWFVLGFIFSIGLAYFYLERTSNMYSVSTSIIIEDGETGGASELAAFTDLGVFAGSKNTLENEIGLLRSRKLMGKVIRNLKANITYYDPNKKANNELYNDQVPFKLNIFIQDSVLYKIDTSFVIESLSSTHFLLKHIEGNIIKKIPFGENIKTNFGEINITPKDINSTNFGEEVIIQITSLEHTIDSYLGRLGIIEPQGLKSTLLEISFVDNVREKGIDILNTLISQYNIDGVNYRESLTESTDKFINHRIEDISVELNLADRGIEDFKNENSLTNMSMESDIALQMNSQLDNKIVDFNSQLRLIDYVIEYIKNNPNDLIPTNLGLQDETTSQNANSYNQLLFERNRILKGSSVLNPTVITLEDQLSGLRESIQQSLMTLRSSVLFALNDAKSQESRLNAKKSLVPRQERQIQDIQRKQQIIETLYLYLLQKREENAIKQGASSPNAKIIDKAHGSYYPVTPNKKKTYVFFGFIGLFIPLLFFTIYLLIDNKIHSIEDIQRIIKAPILGDIPKTKLRKIISQSDRDSLAEAFRLLRTNLTYMLPRVKKAPKIIFLTSTIPGEGKTFISLNLASVLSSTDKKVLVIGADLRKPKLSKYLKINKNNSRGLTHFLIDEELNVSDLVQTIDKHNFDIINSGEVPPNPSELLMNERFEKVLDFGRLNYDYVIVDTPPVSLVADTLLLSHYADLFIYVIRANFLDKRLLKTPKTLYDNNRLPNMALLVNGSEYDKGYGYGYGYGYGENHSKKSWWKIT